MPRHATPLAIAVAAIAGACPALAQAPAKAPQPFAFKDADIKLFEECEALDKQFERRGLVFHNADVEKHLADIAAPLVPGAPMERVVWRFRILRDPAVNAFALPNGSVYLNEGLIARLENDDQLAGALAREITHAANRHAYLFDRKRRKETVMKEAFSVPMTSMALWPVITDAADRGPVLRTVVLGGYEPNLEEAADSGAVNLLKQAGRDAAQLIRVIGALDYGLDPEPAPFFWNDHRRLRAHRPPDESPRRDPEPAAG